MNRIQNYNSPGSLQIHKNVWANTMLLMQMSRPQHLWPKLFNKGPQIFQKSSTNLRILANIWCKFHSEDPHELGSSEQELVTQGLWTPFYNIHFTISTNHHHNISCS